LQPLPSDDVARADAASSPLDDAGSEPSATESSDASAVPPRDDIDRASDEEAARMDPDEGPPSSRPTPRPDPSVYRGECEIGLVNADDDACFQPHDPNIAIPLVGASQGDLLVELAVRARDARGAIADLVITAKDSGRTDHARVTAKDFRCGEDLACGDLDDDRWCKALPVWMVTWGLVDDPYDLMDLPVTIEMTLRDADGPLCTTSIEGFLYRF
jgi:hypothetical protein